MDIDEAKTPSPEVAYWRLIRDLRRRELEVHGKKEQDDWVPLAVTADVLLLHPSTSRNAVQVTITFDERFSQRGLVAAIRREWPRIVACGMVRRSRPLRPAAQSLIRLVCMDAAPGTTWAERSALWNKKYARRFGVRYDSPFLLQRDFRRAEKQLTGEPYGLEYIYNPVALLDDEDGRELSARKAAGDKEVIAYLDRRTARWKRKAERSRKIEDCNEGRIKRVSNEQA